MYVHRKILQSKLCFSRGAGKGKILHLEFSIFLFVLTLTRKNDAKETLLPLSLQSFGNLSQQKES